MITASPALRGALYALVAMALYCLYDVAIKQLGGSYSPVQILFCAGLFFVPLILGQLALGSRGGDRNLRPVWPLWMAIRVAATLVNGIVGAYAFATLPLAQCYAVFFLMPLMISLLAVPMLGERMDLARGLAILGGLFGVFVALQPGEVHLGLCHLAAFSAAALGALNYVMLRKSSAVERPGVQMLYPALAQFLVTAAAMPFFWLPMPIEDWLMSAFMAVAVFLGSLLIIAAYRNAPVIIVAPMQYSQIIWAALLGRLFFDESMSPTMIFGIAVICAAGIFILISSSKSESPSNP
jgi:S-adenosylmethionine uptake transporter